MAKSDEKPAQEEPGPDPEILQIEGDWQEAVSKALKTPRPPEGWPDEVKPKKRTKKETSQMPVHAYVRRDGVCLITSVWPPDKAVIEWLGENLITVHVAFDGGDEEAKKMAIESGATRFSIYHPGVIGPTPPSEPKI